MQSDVDGAGRPCNTVHNTAEGASWGGWLMAHLGLRAGAVSAITLVLVTLTALTGFWGFDVTDTHAGDPESMDAMTIDAITSGNSATSLGPVNSCVSAASGNVVVDVTALNIPASTAMLGFTLVLNYDPDVFTVTAANGNFLLVADPDSSIFAIPDPLPDSDGAFGYNAADVSGTPGETGSGVLARITLNIKQPVTNGVHNLTLTNAAHIDALNDSYPPNVINNATVAISESCPVSFGDVDCSGGVNAVDALKVLRFGASLPVQQIGPEPDACEDLGTALGNGELQGDVDCSDAVNAVDALKLLRFGASLSVQQNDPCPDVGTQS